MTHSTQQKLIIYNILSCSFHSLSSIINFHSLKGIRPELILKTGDGATLLPTDSLALIFSISTDENIIHSEIRDWKLPSLEKRYIEACSEYKCGECNNKNVKIRKIRNFQLYKMCVASLVAFFSTAQNVKG